VSITLKFENLIFKNTNFIEEKGVSFIPIFYVERIIEINLENITILGIDESSKTKSDGILYSFY
jgi:hypothetical protein